MRIHKLSSLVANQIAAGEVIERPASVVKEVVENAIDAGSQQIDLTIEKGGMVLMRIRDDGEGIVAEDLPLAIAAHATSKIKEVEDIHHITSLGFRGEALASISSVSRFALTSRVADSDHGYQLKTEGREQAHTVAPCAHPVGTTVEVRDLFFNTPARRRFLRSEKTEFDHIVDVVKRLAMSHPGIQFALTHNGKLIWQVAPAKTDSAARARLSKLCGNHFLKSAIAVSVGAAGLNLQGWIGLPDDARSDMVQQYCFINDRMIKDKLINHAIRSAFHELLSPGKHPCYFLNLHIPPDLVDVNVHPTKHEVRFVDGRFIHDFVFRSVHKALTQALHPEVEIANKPTQQYCGNDTITLSEPNLQKQPLFPPRPALPTNRQSQLMGYRALHPKISKAPKRERHAPLGKVLGQVAQRFVLTENQQGLVIVDIEQARALIGYMTLSAVLQGKAVIRSPLLLPETVKLTRDATDRIEQGQELLASLGFVCQPSGPQTVLVREIPTVMKGVDLQKCLSCLIEHLKSPSESIEPLLWALAFVYGQSDIKYQHEEIESLLLQLEQLPQLPHQLPAFKQLTLSDLRALFLSPSLV